jgi:hypothetical protein
MDRYPQAASHHPPARKRFIITILMDTTKTTGNEINQAFELQHVKFILRASGYFLQDISRATKVRPVNKSNTEKRAIQPQIQGTTDHISRPGVRVQKPLDRIVSRFKSTKDIQLSTKKSGIYKIPCYCGNVHIGQTMSHIHHNFGTH